MHELPDGRPPGGGLPSPARCYPKMSTHEHVLYHEPPPIARPPVVPLHRSASLSLAKPRLGLSPAINFAKERVLRAHRGALLWLDVRNWFSAMIGACLENIHASARMRAFEYVDPDSGQAISLSTARDYSVLSVGDRRFYFGRISGKFDGASSIAPSVCPPSRLVLFSRKIVAAPRSPAGHAPANLLL